MSNEEKTFLFITLTTESTVRQVRASERAMNSYPDQHEQEMGFSFCDGAMECFPVFPFRIPFTISFDRRGDSDSHLTVI